MNEKSSTDSTAHSIDSSSNTSFNIRFAPGGWGSRPAFNSFSFRGKGQLKIDSQGLTLSGKRARSLWLGASEKHSFPLVDICDAHLEGRLVAFRIESRAMPTQIVTFAAKSIEDARAILELLPSRHTPAFVHHQEEITEFQQRLDTLSPTAYITPALVAANILVFAIMVLHGAGVFTPDGEMAIKWGSNYGPMTLSGQYWRLLTSTFIHFGILHLAFNMYALFQTGILVERLFGSLRFLVLYIFSGLAGSVASILWHPLVNSAGASGAIFGVFGGLLALTLNSQMQVPKSVLISHRNSTVVFIGYNLLNGFSHAGIDNGAHLGGLLCGVAMGIVLAHPLTETARKASWHRVIYGISLSILILGVTGYTLFPARDTARQDLTFIQSLNKFGTEESKAINDYNDLVKKSADNTVLQTSTEIEHGLLPEWDELYNLIASTKLDTNSKKFPLQQALLTYCNDRRKHLQLLESYIRNPDADLRSQITKMSGDIEAQIEKIKALSKNE